MDAPGGGVGGGVVRQARNPDGWIPTVSFQPGDVEGLGYLCGICQGPDWVVMAERMGLMGWACKTRFAQWHSAGLVSDQGLITTLGREAYYRFSGDPAYTGNGELIANGCS